MKGKTKKCLQKTYNDVAFTQKHGAQIQDHYSIIFYYIKKYGTTGQVKQISPTSRTYDTPLEKMLLNWKIPR